MRPANPAFTMSNERTCARIDANAYSKLINPSPRCDCITAGGADRDRTDDLKLAKLALSQLSYGPGKLTGHQSAFALNALRRDILRTRACLAVTRGTRAKAGGPGTS